MSEKLYHIVQINEKTGSKVYMTDYPMNHKNCCTMLSKMIKWTKHFNLRNQLEEVEQ